MLFPSPKEPSVPICRRYVPRRTRYPRLSVLLIALPLIIACSSSAAPVRESTPPEGTQQLVIRGQDTMRFALPAPVVEAGVRVAQQVRQAVSGGTAGWIGREGPRLWKSQGLQPGLHVRASWNVPLHVLAAGTRGGRDAWRHCCAVAA